MLELMIPGFLQISSKATCLGDSDVLRFCTSAAGKFGFLQISTARKERSEITKLLLGEPALFPVDLSV